MLAPRSSRAASRSPRARAISPRSRCTTASVCRTLPARARPSARSALWCASSSSPAASAAQGGALAGRGGRVGEAVHAAVEHREVAVDVRDTDEVPKALVRRAGPLVELDRAAKVAHIVRDVAEELEALGDRVVGTEPLAERDALGNDVARVLVAALPEVDLPDLHRDPRGLHVLVVREHLARLTE